MPWSPSPLRIARSPNAPSPTPTSRPSCAPGGWRAGRRGSPRAEQTCSAMGPCVARRALAAPSGAHLAAADARLASEALSRPTAQRGGGRCLLIPPVAATDSPPARGLTMPMHRRLVFLAISLRPSRGGQSCIVIGTHWPDPLVPVPAQVRKSRLPRLASRTPSHPVVSPDDRYASRHSRKPARGRCHSVSSDDCSPYGQRNSSESRRCDTSALTASP